MRQIEQSPMRKMGMRYEECLEVGMTPDQKTVFLIVDEWWKKINEFCGEKRRWVYVVKRVGGG